MKRKMKSHRERVLITGANGFIGSHLFRHLADCHRECVPIAGIRSIEHANSFSNYLVLGNLEDLPNRSSNALQGVSVVVHTAARAHILGNLSKDSLEEFRKINTEGTLALARLAASSGVRRFIYLSSIGVNGNTSNYPFSRVDNPSPTDPYAVSKLEAEQALARIQDETGIEVVVIRPPLVYGPSAPGNFGLLVKVIRKNLPLPLAGIRNIRSFVSVWNLVDLIRVCLDHPDAVGQTFLVRDGQDVSTSELLREIGEALGRPARLFKVPNGLLKIGAVIIGKQAIYRRLVDSLQVDDSHTRNILAWNPPLTLREGIERCFLN